MGRIGEPQGLDQASNRSITGERLGREIAPEVAGPASLRKGTIERVADPAGGLPRSSRRGARTSSLRSSGWGDSRLLSGDVRGGAGPPQTALLTEVRSRGHAGFPNWRKVADDVAVEILAEEQSESPGSARAACRRVDDQLLVLDVRNDSSWTSPHSG